MIWKPWGRRTEHAQRELEDAKEAQQEVIENLVPETRDTVHRVFRIKHENHLGETFDKALRGGRAI